MKDKYPLFYEALDALVGPQRAEELLVELDANADAGLEDDSNISRAIAWDSTKQGHKFWDDLFMEHQKLRALKKLLGAPDED